MYLSNVQIKKAIIVVTAIAVAFFLLNFHAGYGKDYIIVKKTTGEERIQSLYYDVLTHEPVDIIGNDPHYELSTIFFEPKTNRFLLYGNKEEEMSLKFGKKIWNTNKWKILFPVIRVYYEGFDDRMFAPLTGIDSYDKEHGDYIPIIKDNIRMSYYEIKYFTNMNGYYLVYPVKEYEGSIEWYMLSDIDQDPRDGVLVELTGNTPDKSLDESIINIAYYDDYDERISGHNSFLIRGSFNKSDKILNVERWWIKVPFTRFGKNYKNTSKYGFTETDIENGTIKYNQDFMRKLESNY